MDKKPFRLPRGIVRTRLFGMCELFGATSNKPFRLGFAFKEFAKHGGRTADNADGWGIAFFDDTDVCQIREPKPAASSPWVRLLEKSEVVSSIVISHVRAASQGNVALKNTHPFTRHLGARVHAFAHNGEMLGIHGKQDFESGKHFVPVGETDSEYAFCALLHRLEGLWAGVAPGAFDERFHVFRRFASVAKHHGSSNLLYSDGETLFVHADRRYAEPDVLKPPGLWWNRRVLKAGEIAKHPGLTIEGHGGEQDVSIVASVPLAQDRSGWTPLDEGSVYAFRGGNMVDFAPRLPLADATWAKNDKNNRNE